MATYAVIVTVFAAALTAAAEQEEALRHSGPVTDIRFRKGHPVSCSQAGAILHQRETPIRMANPAYRVTSIAVSREEGYFHWYYAGGIPGESGNISGLRESNGKWTANLKVADDLVYSIEAHRGVFLALADGRVLHWEAADIEPKIIHQHTAPARSVRVSPNRKSVASGGLDRLIFISACSGAGEGNPVTIQDHTAAVECLAFSPDSTRIASGARDGKVRIHTVPDGKLIRTYGNLAGEVSAIAWGGKPERLLSGTTEGRIYQLDLANDTAAVIDDWGAESPVTALAIDSKGIAYAGTLNRLNPVRSSE